MPANLITSLILKTLETNVKLAENMASFIKGGEKGGETPPANGAPSPAANSAPAAAPDKGKFVYRFGGGSADGSAGMKELLGGKGANLAEMSNLGLPVPPGFTITTEVCSAYSASGKQYPAGLKAQVEDALAFIGRIAGMRFGDAHDPLLVSIRSGARASMPGMMDTVLNLGLNDMTVEALARKSGDQRFAYDSYRRFMQMYSDVVLGMDHHVFEEILEKYKDLQGYERDTDVRAADWQVIIGKYKQAVEAETGKPFPQDIHEQLWGAIGAVFDSWQNARAITYRRLQNIPDDWGTAVNVQAMVFGNMGDNSATGVAFTRNPSTGENKLYGEFLVNAQGEDVVAGIRTPQNITEEARIAASSEDPSLEALMPATFAEFLATCNKLEAHYRDMQDIEFTIQDGKLWMLQTRTGKRTTPAALKIAVEMAEGGVISKEEGLSRIDPTQLDQLLHPTIDPDADVQILTKGLAASPGAACGEIVFTADEAAKLRGEGKTVILVRTETSPEDIHGMDAAAGILTSRGGMTSHAAVVARGWGRPCITGASGVRIDMAAQTMTAGGVTLSKGDIITIDGSTGVVIKGEVPMRQPSLSGDFAKLMEWADATRRMKVRANAETERDAKQARGFGAEGIGLCRTEHMFFEGERIVAMREMILANDEAGRRTALAKILPMQRQDFIEIFEIMAGLPVTIRLLDPPLHEFLPHTEEEMANLATASGIDIAVLKQRASLLTEFEPDARPSRLPSGGHVPGNRRDAGARHLRGRRRGRQAYRPAGDPRGDDPAGGDQAGTRHAGRAHCESRERGFRRSGHGDQIPPRHHDRAAARRAAGRRNRPDGGVLLLRHQRLDADHLRPQPRRRRLLPHRIYEEGAVEDRPVRVARSGRRGRTCIHRGGAWTQDAAGD